MDRCFDKIPLNPPEKTLFPDLPLPSREREIEVMALIGG
jgi:hypothetical protein